jgi:hypothetical protein
MGGNVVDEEVVLLDVLAVIPLRVGQAEETFLDDRVLFVPQREREAQALLLVAQPGHTVLAPSIRARA